MNNKYKTRIDATLRYIEAYKHEKIQLRDVAEVSYFSARQQPALADKKLILVAHSIGAEVLHGIGESAQPA